MTQAATPTSVNGLSDNYVGLPITQQRTGRGPRMTRVILGLLALAVYLNIGWAFGTYYHKNVVYSHPKTVMAKIAAGPREAVYDAKAEKDPSRITPLGSYQKLFSLLWIFPVVGIGLSWIALGL